MTSRLPKRVAYDLDGVLAVAPPPSEKSWMRMKGPERQARQRELLYHYRTAKVLTCPDEEEFWVITARKGEDPVVQATMAWLDQAFGPRVRNCTFLSASRSIENVVAHKAAAIRRNHIKEFTEDNLHVVRGLRAEFNEDVKIWLFPAGLSARPKEDVRTLGEFSKGRKTAVLK